MPEAIIFPARVTEADREEPGKDRMLFEIFSVKKVDAPDSSGIRTIQVEGRRWYRRLESMDESAYIEFCVESLPVSRKRAAERAGRIFSRYRRNESRPRIMGILNATPDSFYPGSRMLGGETALIDRLLEEKPDIVDIGGESTRPGSAGVGTEEEIRRISPFVEYVTTSYDIPVSVDTRNPETAEAVMKYGISCLNDVSGFRNPEMIRIASENQVDCIVMHMRGEPDRMQNMTSYEDLIFELNLFFSERTEAMHNMGIEDSSIILDPGIGFAKGVSGNLDIIHNLTSLDQGYRILAGHSRKTFIGSITGEPVEKRLPGTIATTLYLLGVKADILRVHDVRENIEAIDAYLALFKNGRE